MFDRFEKNLIKKDKLKTLVKRYCRLLKYSKALEQLKRQLRKELKEFVRQDLGCFNFDHKGKSGASICNVKYPDLNATLQIWKSLSSYISVGVRPIESKEYNV